MCDLEVIVVSSGVEISSEEMKHVLVCLYKLNSHEIELEGRFLINTGVTYLVNT